MNRIIKFRVWDKGMGRMHICGENSHDSMDFFDYEGIGENIACYNNLQNGEGSSPDGEATYELMEFTGMKDGSGKEIFEGDLITFDSELHVVEYEPDSAMYGARVVGSQCYTSLFSIVENWGIRGYIVGNVYENPELLEGDASV